MKVVAFLKNRNTDEMERLFLPRWEGHPDELRKANLDKQGKELVYHGDVPVKYVHGTLKAKHFAYVNKDLAKYEGGGESSRHLNTKLWVKESLNKLGLEGKVEVPVDMEWRRKGRIADVLLDVPERNLKIAFEIQCSGMSIKEMEQRTEDYRRMGILTFWMLRHNLLMYGRAKRRMRGFVDLPVARIIWSEDSDEVPETDVFLQPPHRNHELWSWFDNFLQEHRYIKNQ